jgi:hypothetical protein
MDFTKLLEDGTHPGLVRFAHHCDNLAGGRRMPFRRDFHMSDVPWMMGHIFLADVLGEKNDYFFSVSGELMKSMYGADFQNRRLSEVGDADRRNILRATYNAVVATETPLYLRGRYVWPDRSICIERLLVPLSDDYGHLSTILGAVFADVPDEMLILFTGEGPARFVPDPVAGRREADNEQLPDMSGVALTR